MGVTLVALFAVGDRMCSIIKVTGPASYTQVTVGTPPAGPTGGQDVPATAFGLKYINEVIGGLDQAGHYNVIAVPNTPSGSEGATKATLLWIIAHTGAEETGTTGLTTFTVRLMAFGR